MSEYFNKLEIKNINFFNQILKINITIIFNIYRISKL